MINNREQTFLEAVADKDCRSIIEAVEERPKSVLAISEECNIPLSTVYRKVSLMEEASLIEEQTQPYRASKPETVYALGFEEARIRVDSDGKLDLGSAVEVGIEGTNDR